VVVGETVDVIDPDGPIGPTGPTPLVRSFRVVGVFHSGLFEYDNRYAYVLIDVARDFVGVPDDAATGVELRAQGPEYAGVVASAVRERLGASGLEGLDVADWMELNSTLFAALELEKYVMGGIMMVIVLVASFAIICVLIMVVIQRGAEIAVLRSMGASQGGILLVFLTQGAAIGVIGTVVGGVLGLGIALALQIVGFPLDPEVYYIDRLPIEVEAREVVSILVGAVVISVLATLYPSVQASRLDPAGGLRYE
jgi:lipoprotein-releasing system permease protein